MISFLLWEKKSPKPKVEAIDSTKGIKNEVGSNAVVDVGFCLSGLMNTPWMMIMTIWVTIKAHPRM